MVKKKIIVIHPGVQHAYRLANALANSNQFASVSLCTWFLLKAGHPLSKIPLFKKRVKPINPSVKLRIFPILELITFLNEKLYFLFFPEKKHSNYNNIQYLYSYFFGLFLVPYLYFNRKKSLLVLYDTCGWPLSYFAKKWHIPVIMDFPSISHESAIALGINETNYGIVLKNKERQHIDFALYCSDFAKETYSNKTSAKLNFTAHVGAALPELKITPINYETPVLQVGFIANMELRKGLDFLLEAVSLLNIPFKLHLIGKISKSWVMERVNPSLIKEGKVLYAGPFNQNDLIAYLQENNIQIHILPSRFDSFGMVVPETMMLGIPNIISPFVGAGEKITNGVNGILMKELTSFELRTLIFNFYHLNPTEKKLISKQAYQLSKSISWSSYNDRIKVIFSEILSSIKPKIGFIVTHPTQFEVPFFQYIQSNVQDVNFDVIYINADQQLHFDKEISRKIDWGFNLYEGYSYHMAKSRMALKELFKNQHYDLLITNGYNGKYLGILDLLILHKGKLALRIDSMKQNQPFAWRLWKVPILKLLFSIFDHFLVVGSLSKNYVLSLGKSEKKINLFSYSIDNQRFEKKASDALEILRSELALGSKKVFLCVAKLVNRESPIDVIQAFIESDQKDWVLLIVGDGKNKNELENYCNNYPLADIRFMGYVNYIQLPLYYHLSQVFIHSTREENWGVSVHEAIVASCTVIASDTVGSAHDLIIEGANGFTYPYRSVSILKDKMKSALNLDAKIKERTNLKIIKEWGYEKMWSEIKSVLDSTHSSN